MKSSIALAVIGMSMGFVSTPVWAKTLECSLTSGTTTSKPVTLNLEDEAAMDEGAASEVVFDLSFYLQASCSEGVCSANATIDSVKVEDEVGQLAFDFNKSQTGNIFKEELTDAPDGLSYSLSCDLK